MRLFSRHQSAVPERRRSLKERQDTPHVSETIVGSYTFRRGRTLTGSASPRVQTLNESQADLKSPRVHAHILAKKRRRLGLVFMLTLIVAASLFVAVSQFTAHADVRATPDPSLSLDPVYVKTIESYLTEHPIQRWRPFIDLDQLAAYMQDATPEVKAIGIDGTVGLGKSLFTLTFREPTASWNISGRELYVDASGVPFSKNYFASPALHITDQSGIPTTSGQTIASNRFMSFIGQIIGLAKQQGYEVTDIIIPPSMTRQVDVRLKGVSYPFKFSSDRPAGEGVEDMVRVVKWMTSKQLTPEYVDVRVKGKAYYK